MAARTPNVAPRTVSYPALDGLRGFAILAVMLFHFAAGYKGNNPLLHASGTLANAGWMGVDLFFVLSGFLITGILYDTAHTENRIRNFYARRALRIFPLFYGLLFSLLLLTPVFHFHWSAGHVLYFVYLGNMTGLFAPGLPNPDPAINLGHLWSLAVEEQFYLIWPFVVWQVKERRRLIWTAIAILIISPMLRFCLFKMHVDQVLIGYLLLTRSDSLLMGGLVALLSRGPSANRLPASIVLLVGIALLTGILILSGGPVEGLWMSTVGYSIIAVCAACLIYKAQFDQSIVSHIFSTKILRWFGRYSYGLYVFHGLFFVFLRHKALVLQPYVRSAAVAQLLILFTGFAVSILLAVLSYKLFEEPLLRFKSRFT